MNKPKTTSGLNQAVKSKIARLKRHMLKNEVAFFGTLLNAAGITRETWARWKSDPDLNEHNLRQMELIEQQFESKLIETAMTGKCNVNVVLFLLKSVYGLSDKMLPLNQNPENARMELPCIKLNDQQIVL